MQNYKIFEHENYDSVSVNMAQDVVEENVKAAIKKIPQHTLFPLLRKTKQNEYLKILVPDLMTATGAKISSFIALINKHDFENIYFSVD